MFHTSTLQRKSHAVWNFWKLNSFILLGEAWKFHESIEMSPPFGFCALAMEGFSDGLSWGWPDPNWNACGGTSRGRVKMEVVLVLLKAGVGTGSLAFGNPKVTNDVPTGGKTGEAGLLPSKDPKVFCSYSCNCWYTAGFHPKTKRNES